MDRKRSGIQAAAALLQNANFKGFFTGKIYRGGLKSICVPGLNCYSCPGAVGACPIGSLQNALGSARFRFPYYVTGLLLFFGALLGRAVCGFLCPMGFLQELVYLIPVPKRNRFRADRYLRPVKYAVLVILVIVLPLLVAYTPFFCKYLCPGGTLAGILLSCRDALLRSRLGGIFAWKGTVLAAILAACLVIWRPFCKYLCPLGAIYGLLNRWSAFRLELDESKCIDCHACADACRMCVDPSKSPDSAECIRCGDCVRACPAEALRTGFFIRSPEKEERS